MQKKYPCYRNHCPPKEITSTEQKVQRENEFTTTQQCAATGIESNLMEVEISGSGDSQEERIYNARYTDVPRAILTSIKTVIQPTGTTHSGNEFDFDKIITYFNSGTHPILKHIIDTIEQIIKQISDYDIHYWNWLFLIRDTHTREPTVKGHGPNQ